MKNRPTYFTLMEVVVALFILAGAVTATMYLLSGSARRTRQAESFRNEAQMLANAIEFFMLYPPNASIDQKFFPYEGMNVKCSYDVPELPEEFEAEIDNRKLVRMTVEITDDHGKFIEKIAIDRIVEAEKL